MKKLFFLIICLFLFCQHASANEAYDLTYAYENGIARVVTNLKWGLIDETGKEVLSPSWDYIGTSSCGLRLVMKNQLFGYMNEENKPLINPVYAQAEPFANDLACVKNSEGKWGFIDKTGKTVIPFEYEQANSFSNSLALVKKDGFYGYIDNKNQTMIPFVYEEAYPFSEGLACVMTDGLYGYIDTSGNQVTPAKFMLAFDFCEGGAVVKTETGYGLIDSSGVYLLTPTWEHLSPNLQEGLLKAKKGGKTALIDTNGNKRTEYLYDEIGTLAEGLMPASQNGKYGYIDKDGKTVIDHEFDFAGAFSEGFAPIAKEGLYGYINAQGELVTKLMYMDAVTVKEGFASVQTEDGKWKFLGTNFEPINEEENAEIKLQLQIGNPMMVQGNKKIELEAAPVLENGFTMLPIRAVIEAIGGTVNWNAEQQKITLTHHGHIVVLRLNESGAFVDGRMTLLDAPPFIQNERTLVPLRFVLEAFFCTVDWNDQTQEILITYSGESN